MDISSVDYNCIGTRIVRKFQALRHLCCERRVYPAEFSAVSVNILGLFGINYN